MKAKKCLACGRIFVSWDKWNTHVTLSVCAKARQEKIAADARKFIDDLDAGKITRAGRRIRRR